MYIHKHKTVYETLFEHRNVFIDICMMVFSVVFLAFLANIQIPLWPVPITGQTFGIFLIAFFFGSRKGALTILLYILAGAAGIGVFAGHKSGIAAIMGPTIGYIFGFLVCVYVVGLLIEKGYGRTKKSVFICLVIGNFIIYFFGILGLWRYMGNVGLIKLLSLGVFPFLIGDALKILAAMPLFPLLWNKDKPIFTK